MEREQNAKNRPINVLYFQTEEIKNGYFMD